MSLGKSVDRVHGKVRMKTRKVEMLRKERSQVNSRLETHERERIGKNADFC